MCLTAEQVGHLQALLGATPAEQQVDTLIAYVTDLPCEAPSGERLQYAVTWVPLARDAMLQLTSNMIRHAVQWIGCCVCHLHGPQLSAWVNGQSSAEICNVPGGGVDYLAVQLLNAIANGTCQCWVRHEDFSLQLIPAQNNCAHHHRLAAWNPQAAPNPIRVFLTRAYLRGRLCLPGDGPPQARTNDFRSGMLAKRVVEDRLRAGQALICGQNQCVGDIRLNDRCGTCNQPSNVTNPRYWLWLDGHRVEAQGRRCGKENCRRVYFQFNGPCHGCGQVAWGQGEINVWRTTEPIDIQSSPVTPGPDVDNDTAPGPSAIGGEPISHDDPLAQLVQEEAMAAGLAGIEHWLQNAVIDPLHLNIITALVLNGSTLAELAFELDVPADSLHFQQVVLEALQQIPQELYLPTSDGEEE